MYAILKTIHSYWAFFVLIILIVAIFNALSGRSSRRTFGVKDLRISLFGLIFSETKPQKQVVKLLPRIERSDRNS